MDTSWIQCFLLFGIILLNHSIHGQSEVEVRLVLVRKFVEKGSSVTLHCEHNVPPKILYKVTWLKENNGKFFQYIQNRNPPYRNFSIPGAEIDWKNSNAEHVQLRNIDFDAAGSYYCEVSTDTPIFTKESNVEQMHVIMQQTGPPRITFSKRQFMVGEKLLANCTTSKAHPAPHITWLINGKKVDDRHIKSIRLHPSSGGNGNIAGSGAVGGNSGSGTGKMSHRSKAHPQNNPSYEKHDGTTHHVRAGLASSERSRGEEPLDSNGNHLGFEIHQNSGYDNSKSTNNGGSSNSKYKNTSNNDNNNNNKNSNINRNNNSHNNNNAFSMAGGNSNVETSDYTDDKHYDTKKHRNVYHSHRKYRRHVNELSGSVSNNRHHLMASSSQLSIEVSELHASNNGRLEITCLATIPAHVGVGEQFADYKTYSVKIDIEQAEQTTILPAMSDMAALGNSSNRNNIGTIQLASLSLSLPIFLVILFNTVHLTNLKCCM